MAILDSTLIIDYLKDEQEAIETVQELISNGEKIKTTIFNYYEIYFGELAFSKSKEKKEIVLSFLDSLDMLFPTIQTIKTSAEVSIKLRKKGKTIGQNDIYIAGIALSNDETVYTKNVNDFSQIEGLKIKQC